MSEHSEHAQATHTHGLSRNALLTLLILTVFFGHCYSSYSYSRVLTGHGYSRAHTHGPLSTALLILTHTHSRLDEFSNPGVEFLSYLVYGVIATGFIQPVAVHWGWSNGWLLYPPEVIRLPPAVWYRDYAGGGNVHAVGGIAALVGCVFMGPREG